MKCPHCYCNYDDSERECPMCGTRASVTFCRDAKHQSVTHPGTRKVGGWTVPAAQPVQRANRNHSAGNAAPRRPVTNTRPQNRTAAQEASKAARKRGRRVIAWVVATLILIQLPRALSDLFYNYYEPENRPDYQDDGFHFFDDGSAAVPVAPEPETEPEDTPDDEISDNEKVTDGIVQGGDYYCDDTELYFTFDFSDQSYWLTVNDYLEYGTFFMMANDPHTDADYYTDEFPAAEYDSYILYLQPDEDWDEGEGYTLAVMYVPANEDTPNHFYLNNTFADARWLPLDRAILLEHW